jgi:hypothetical protein
MRQDAVACSKKISSVTASIHGISRLRMMDQLVMLRAGIHGARHKFGSRRSLVPHCSSGLLRNSTRIAMRRPAVTHNLKL